MTRLAVDIGARFADLCLWGDGFCQVAKVEIAEHGDLAVLQGITELGTTPQAIDEIRIATTVPLNTHLATQRAPVGLITNRGFEDVLTLARQDRASLYDPVARSSAPCHLVDAADIHGISGRIDVNGREVAPIEPVEIARCADSLRRRGVRAVAVCLLFASANPVHERQVAEVLDTALPGVHVSLSHRVDPFSREYERSVATLLDAWLRLTSLAPLEAVESQLAAAGFTGEILWCDGRGVLIGRREAWEDPTGLFAGGPAAAARAAAHVATGDGVAIDIGSMSTDLGLFRAGEPVLADRLNPALLPLRRDAVDMTTMALGGGREVDNSDGITLDDALRHLGRLAPSVNGNAKSVSETVARKIVDDAEARVTEAAIRFATGRNLDPWRAELVVMGGTGMLLAAGIAQAMGIGRVLLPPAPASAGALGVATALRRHEAIRHVDRSLQDMSAEALAVALDALHDTLSTATGVAGADRYLITLSARPGMHPFRLELDERPNGPGDIADAFADAYRMRYGIGPPGSGHLATIRALLEEGTGTIPEDVWPEFGTALSPRTAIHVPEGWTLSRIDRGWALEEAGG